VAVVNQNSSNGSVNVTLSAPPAPNPIHQGQSAPPLQEQQEVGWARCNDPTLPVPVATPIYPQLHHGRSGHNGTEQHFQNSMPMQAGPSSIEVQYPQEYYNPPAYLPPYDQRSVRNI